MRVQRLEAIALTWAQRAQAELGAEKRFEILSAQMVDFGASERVVSLTRKAQDDERRHAVICSEVARDLGHETGFAFFEGQPFQSEKPWAKRELAQDRFLCEIVLMCCITETINASLLNSIFNRNIETSEQKVIHEILRDEVRHSQIGWAYLSSECQKRDCSFLSEHLGQMLDISVKDELFASAPANIDDADSFTFGVMPVALRLEQFKETVNKVVLPGV